MNDSRLLLLDEPEAGVDAGGTEMLYQLLSQLVAERQLTALVISHELNIVVQVASQVLCLVCPRSRAGCHGDRAQWLWQNDAVAQHPRFYCVVGFGGGLWPAD